MTSSLSSASFKHAVWKCGDKGTPTTHSWEKSTNQNILSAGRPVPVLFFSRIHYKKKVLQVSITRTYAQCVNNLVTQTHESQKGQVNWKDTENLSKNNIMRCHYHFFSKKKKKLKWDSDLKEQRRRCVQWSTEEWDWDSGVRRHVQSSNSNGVSVCLVTCEIKRADK